MNEILVIFLLILLNGIFAMSEIALISVRKSLLSTDAKNGSKVAKIALKLIEQPDNFLSTVQIGITIIGILTGIYSGSVLADSFAITLQDWGVPFSVSHEVAQSVIVILVTYFTLIFGELVPKRIGMSLSRQTTKIIARPMYYLSIITLPFVWLLAKSTSFIFNILNLNPQADKITEEEIKSMIEEGTRGGEVAEVEHDIMERVFLLGDLRISSIMTHRSDIIALDINMTKEKIKDVLRNDMYEVYPVIDSNLDNVKGVITLKSLVLMFDEDKFDISKNLIPALYVHENTNVFKVLDHLKEKRLSQALVCDEFGSCQGIITLKDILGALVGNVDDTVSEPDIIKRQDAEGWLIDGQCPFYDFLTFFDKEELQSNNNYNTLGGLMLDKLDHIPQSGEWIEWETFKLEIVDMDSARIDKILLTIIEKGNEE